MNERIEKLALQAKEYADTKYSKLVSASRWGDCVPGIRELYTEKLAELIVRECTHIIANQAWESRTAGANGDWTEYNTLSRVAGQIKEHFGVKE